jgi:autotransporter translocation and assembly factor TamB
MLSEGTMNGEAIGLTVDGTLDFTHDSVDMRGTFVPIYAFNNMFARIPVVGLILGGGSEEQGLIGVNWRISGKASAPVLSINPLSAVAPGIFRQIFGVVDFDPLHPRQ